MNILKNYPLPILVLGVILAWIGIPLAAETGILLLEAAAPCACYFAKIEASPTKRVDWVDFKFESIDKF